MAKRVWPFSVFMRIAPGAPRSFRLGGPQAPASGSQQAVPRAFLISTGRFSGLGICADQGRCAGRMTWNPPVGALSMKAWGGVQRLLEARQSKVAKEMEEVTS